MATAAAAVDDDIFSNLLSPLSLGPFTLSHRVVLAPLTRCRGIDYVPRQAHVEYYAQRASPGGLLITEAVAVSPEGIGYPHSPGIWSTEQIKAWAKVVDAVHAKGAVIFCQIWHVGRASHTYYQPDGKAPVSSTAQAVGKNWKVLLPDGGEAEYPAPRPLVGEAEIAARIADFRTAAVNASIAGFDGVEIHAAHGYLLDQFLKDGVNDRTDDFGGSLANRCRFLFSTVAAVADSIGADRTAVRISPASDHLDAVDSSPYALAAHLASELRRRWPAPRLAYLHVTEPRMTRHGIRVNDDPDQAAVILATIRAAFRGGRLMLSGGFTRETGMEAVRGGAADLVSYGRQFIANPDLPLRFAVGAQLNDYDRSTFFTHDPVRGYVDYPALPLLPFVSTARAVPTPSAADTPCLSQS